MVLLKGTRHKRQGFTFPEIMISLVVFAIAFVPIYGMVSFSNKTSIMARNRSLAEKLLIEKIEEYKHMPFNVLVYENPASFEGCYFEKGDTSRDSVVEAERGKFVGAGPGGIDYPPEYARYGYQVLVRPVVWNGDSLDMVEIEVTLDWLNDLSHADLPQEEMEKRINRISNATFVRRFGTT